MENLVNLVAAAAIKVIDLLPPKVMIDRIQSRMNPSEFVVLILSYLTEEQIESLCTQQNSSIDIC